MNENNQKITFDNLSMPLKFAAIVSYFFFFFYLVGILAYFFLK